MIHLGTATRVCFVKFKDPSSVHVAQHLTNTVFIDRALIVVPVQDGKETDKKIIISLVLMYMYLLQVVNKLLCFLFY